MKMRSFILEMLNLKIRSTIQTPICCWTLVVGHRLVQGSGITSLEKQTLNNYLR